MTYRNYVLRKHGLFFVFISTVVPLIHFEEKKIRLHTCTEQEHTYGTVLLCASLN